MKTWKLSGLAQGSATDSLVRLNTQEGMGEVFEAVKNSTGNSAFDLSKPTRNLLVNLDYQENSDFNPEAPPQTPQSFPYKFALEITQRIEAADPLAVPLTKL